MFALLLGLALLQTPGTIERDAYGVPRVTAPNPVAAMRLMGQAVAEDRMWQMELSRRQARGRLAAVMGSRYAASDREVLSMGYTDEELQAQVEALAPRVRALWQAYADGVNAHLAAAKAEGRLPPGFAANGFNPDPWSLVDSAAIAIRMAHTFGGGGRGELRNYALLLYLRGQPVKDWALDVFDDLAWQNDPRSIPTVGVGDDPLARSHPKFPNPTREETEAHLARLPEANLLELLPAARMARDSASESVAIQHGLPYKWGSYAILVGAERSALGVPLLLGAPEMGHSAPSIVHEIILDAPGLRVQGIGIPGVPGVPIGMTPNMAWTLTTSVADTADVFFSPLDGPDHYLYGAERRPVQRIVRILQIKGEAPQEVVQLRTHYGPVMLRSRVGNCLYSFRRAFWMRELAGFAALFDLYGAKTLADVGARAQEIPLGFNLFVATTGGEIGWWYCGQMPIRAQGFDPRLPLPGVPDADWRGFIPFDQMPRAANPKAGILANWNNKPAAWWPNLDTPVWGRLFRNAELLSALPGRKLTPFDLERAAWTIARRDVTTMGAFLPLARRALGAAFAGGRLEIEAVRHLIAFDGWNVEGAVGARVYAEWVRALRREVFERHTGGFVQADLFETILQPSVLLDALEGRTRFDFLAGRHAEDVARTALRGAVDRLKTQAGDDPAAWGWTASRISVPDRDPILYGQRGTYIQVVELTDPPRGRNVASPGVAEAGPNAFDQAPLARDWRYKPMYRFRAP